MYKRPMNFFPSFLRSLAPRCRSTTPTLVHLPRPSQSSAFPELPGGWRGAGSREPVSGRGATHGWSGWCWENGPERRGRKASFVGSVLPRPLVYCSQETCRVSAFSEAISNHRLPLKVYLGVGWIFCLFVFYLYPIKRLVIIVSTTCRKCGFTLL